MKYPRGHQERKKRGIPVQVIKIAFAVLLFPVGRIRDSDEMKYWVKSCASCVATVDIIPGVRSARDHRRGLLVRNASGEQN